MFGELNCSGFRVQWLAWLALVLACASLPALGAEAPPASSTALHETNAVATAPLGGQLQEPTRAVQPGGEQNQPVTNPSPSTAPSATAESLAVRLQALETTLAAERVRDLEATRSLHHLLVLLAGIAAGFGLITLSVLAVLHWRLVNHLVLGPLPSRRIAEPTGVVADLESAQALAQPVRLGPVEASSQRFLDALERLEKRIGDIEHAAAPAAPSNLPPAAETASAATPEPEAEVEPAGESARIRLLLGKGQSLLQLGQADAALNCLDQVLALDAANADALVKKGMALEQLGRLNDAVECYDRAIAVDRSLTLAYVYKAGLFNRMQRFNEALDCYEQALRSQSRRRS